MNRVVATELRPLVREAEAQGWTVERTGGGHLKWTPPDSKLAVYSSSTPSDWRVVRKIRAALRQRGFVGG